MTPVPAWVQRLADRETHNERFVSEAERRRVVNLDAIRAWRATEYAAGRPSGLGDYFDAQDVCPECKGRGDRVLWPSHIWPSRVVPCERCETTGRFRPAVS